MGAFFICLINSIIKGLGVVLSLIVAILPTSPFSLIEKNATVEEFLGYINYVIPLNEIIAIGETWLVAIGVYYIYSIVLRWLKAID